MSGKKRTAISALVFLAIFNLSIPAQAYNGIFTPTGNMSVGRYCHTATKLADGKVLITGGTSNPKENGYWASRSAELYDPATYKFTPTGNMVQMRRYHTATLLKNGKVLITGGLYDSSTSVSAELYDPATGTFSATGAMVAWVYRHHAVLLDDGRVLIVGGEEVAGPNASGIIFNTTQIYNPATGLFSAGPTMAATRYWGENAIKLNSGKVLITGGGSSVSAELFDPNTNTLTATGNLNTARVGQGMSLLSNGQVLVSGGNDNSANAVYVAELYNATNGTFSTTGSLSSGRSAHNTIVLSDGEVFIGIGSPRIATTGPYEIYNSASGLFRNAGFSWGNDSEGQPLVALDDGSVLITGGYLSSLSNSGSYTNKAYLFATKPYDSVAPVIMTQTPKDNEFLDQPYTISGVISDILPSAGIKEVQIQVFDGVYYRTSTGWSATETWIAPTSFTDTSFTLDSSNWGGWTAGKKYTVSVKGSDNAGNVSNISKSSFTYYVKPVFDGDLDSEKNHKWSVYADSDLDINLSLGGGIMSSPSAGSCSVTAVLTKPDGTVYNTYSITSTTFSEKITGADSGEWALDIQAVGCTGQVTYSFQPTLSGTSVQSNTPALSYLGGIIAVILLSAGFLRSKKKTVSQ